MERIDDFFPFSARALRFVSLEIPLHKGVEALMRFFENWWERAPLYVRVALFAVSIVGMVLGGASDAYWE